MSLYVSVSASFDYYTQREEVELHFTREKPTTKLYLDVSFLLLNTSFPQVFDGVVFRRNRKCFEFVLEENVDTESHWPGEDDIYWAWSDLEDEFKDLGIEDE